MVGMEHLTTKDAAEQLGVNVPKFFRLTDAHQITPVIEAPGKRGAKFWNPADIDTLAAQLAETGAA